MSISKRLINALNLICEYVEDHLEPGWELIIKIENGESSMSLIRPDSTEEHVDAEHSVSQILALCDTSRQVTREEECNKTRHSYVDDGSVVTCEKCGHAYPSSRKDGK